MGCLGFVFLCVFGSCSSSSEDTSYLIGVDPSWFPLNVSGKEPNLLAFTNEIFMRISEISSIPIKRVTVNWDSIIENLKKEKYDAMLSAMEPYVFNLETYSFSELFLETGPVLVVKDQAKLSSLENLRDMEIAVFTEQGEEIIGEKYPDALPRMLDSVPAALVDVSIGSLDGALIDVIEASGYVSDIYSGRLKIVAGPFTDMGLRLVSLKGKQKHLMKRFQEGLNHLKSSGEYETILKKWKLGY